MPKYFETLLNNQESKSEEIENIFIMKIKNITKYVSLIKAVLGVVY